MIISTLFSTALAAPVHLPALPDTPIAHHGLQVKLLDDTGARLRDGALTGADLGAFTSVLSNHGASLRNVYGPHAQQLVDRAEARTGLPQPDLLATFAVELPTTEPHRIQALAERLADLEAVDWVQIVAHGAPPPVDIFPTTGSWEGIAAFQDTALGGLDVDYLRSEGITGTGIVVHDIEYGWTTTHEDFEDIDFFEEPAIAVPNWVFGLGWDAHGTSTVGEIAAPENGYGMAGVTPDVTVGLFPEFEANSRRADAIASAGSMAVPGDVLMLEMQTDIIGGYFTYGPAELERSVFDATQVAVAAGLVVVSAAGNGTQDLDDAFYQAAYGVWGDSGAIIVGAGTADTTHTPLFFSTFGSRVDVQAWGELVETLGYGDLAYLNLDWNQTYTSVFGGTSSATPIVTSAVVAIQEFAIERSGTPLPPDGVRQLLRDTGIPQGVGVEIGPFPDLAAAFAALDGDADGSLTATYGGGDCDDADPAVNPDAIEVVNDGTDSDCDGSDLAHMTLEVSPAVAGVANTWSVANATPSETVMVVHGEAGVTVAPCGTPLGLTGPAEIDRDVADAAGDLTVTGTPPASASGGTRTFQAVEISTCRVSDPVTVTFL